MHNLTQVPWVPCGMSTLVVVLRERGALVSIDFVSMAGYFVVLLKKIFFNDFLIFQCLASCLVSEFGQSWWPVSMVALFSTSSCFEFLLKLVINFKWLCAIRVTGLCGCLSEKESLFSTFQTMYMY